MGFLFDMLDTSTGQTCQVNFDREICAGKSLIVFELCVKHSKVVASLCNSTIGVNVIAVINNSCQRYQFIWLHRSVWMLPECESYQPLSKYLVKVSKSLAICVVFQTINHVSISTFFSL